MAPSAQRFLLLFTFLKKNASKKVPLLHHAAYTRPMQHTPRLCAHLGAATTSWSCVELGALSHMSRCNVPRILWRT